MTDETRIFALGAVIVSAVYLWVGVQPLLFLDRIFVHDDTYYILAIARSLAQGLGPSADGVIPTSGFQPLGTFLLVPVFWLTDVIAPW